MRYANITQILAEFLRSVTPTISGQAGYNYAVYDIWA